MALRIRHAKRHLYMYIYKVPIILSQKIIRAEETRAQTVL